jgi:aminoglycoside 3-N-acetyltransferase
MENVNSFQDLLIQGKVKKGDVLMVHSSYSTVKNLFSSPDDLLQECLDYLGPDGTLLIPVFNFSSWSNSHYFDILETPSEMGILTEFARMRKDGVRTKHPIYSFIVFGKLKNEFSNCNDTEAFGDNSVFGLFYQLGGNIMSIGLNFNSSFTFQHFVELKAGITYRRIKEFSGVYVGQDRLPQLKTYSMFVRSNLKYKTVVSPGLEILQAKGIIQAVHINETKVDFCRAQLYYANVFEMVLKTPQLFYQTS